MTDGLSYDLFLESSIPNEAHPTDGMRQFWLDCECPDGAEMFTQNASTSATQSFWSVGAVVDAVSDEDEGATAHDTKAAAAVQVPHRHQMLSPDARRQTLDTDADAVLTNYTKTVQIARNEFCIDPVSGARISTMLTNCTKTGQMVRNDPIGEVNGLPLAHILARSRSSVIPSAFDTSLLPSVGPVADVGLPADATKADVRYGNAAHDGIDDDEGGALKPAEAAAILEKNAAPETESKLPPRPLRFTAACGQVYYERSSGDRRRVRGPKKDVWKAHGGRKSQGRLFTSKTMAVLMIRTSGSVFDSNSRKRGRYIAFTSVMHDGSDIGTVWQVRKPHSDEHSRPQKNQKLPNKTSESAW